MVENVRNADILGRNLETNIGEIYLQGHEPNKCKKLSDDSKEPKIIGHLLITCFICNVIESRYS